MKARSISRLCNERLNQVPLEMVRSDQILYLEEREDRIHRRTEFGIRQTEFIKRRLERNTLKDITRFGPEMRGPNKKYCDGNDMPGRSIMVEGTAKVWLWTN